MESQFDFSTLSDGDLEALPEAALHTLVQMAREARTHAYTRYSGYGVGAALLVNSAELGKRIFVGCNVENEAYSPTLCAERVAAGSAIAAGAEPGSFVAVAVVAGKVEHVPGEARNRKPASPCGVCRQVLYELSGGDMLVISAHPTGNEKKKWTIKELLPDAFSGQV